MLPRYLEQRVVAPAPDGPLRYEADAAAPDLQDQWAVEHTAASGAEVTYWKLQEHGLDRDPLYGEPTVRKFAGPYQFFAHVTLPDAIPEVTDQGFRATWQTDAWVARAALEAAGLTDPPSEGDVLGLWLKSGFFADGEAQQGDTVRGANFYFTVSSVTDAGHLFSSPEFVGFTLALLRNTNFAPERRIEGTL